MTAPSTTRAVLLFARSDAAEARAKGLGPRGRGLFELSRRRIAAAARRLGVDLVVVGAPGGLAPAHVLPQRGLDFGARLAAAFEDARALGYREVVAVGLDSPGLSARHLARAFSALARRDVVLGPSPDGGVYLLGATVAVEGFARVRWLSRHVFSDLRRAFPSAARLDPLADVDGLGDARRVAAGDPAVQAILRQAGLLSVTRTAADVVPGARYAAPVTRIRGPPAA